MTEMNEPDLRLRAVLPAPLKVVYEALTDPAALRVWLAEHAEVDLPGTYEFWGRFTPDGAEPHQRVLHVDERTIRFAWALDGFETTSQFEVDEDEDGTLVTLSQTDLPSFEDVIADRAGPRGTLQTFWALAIANLVDYVAGRELTPKCDFTSKVLRASVVIGAAPDEVFASMTQADHFRRWFGANVDIEPHLGGAAVRRRRRDDQLGAGRVGRQDPAHDGAQRVRPRQPAVLGLGRLAEWPRRAAALPRDPAVAHDLASDRDRGPPRGHHRARLTLKGAADRAAPARPAPTRAARPGSGGGRPAASR